ncbi:MAG TPA: hypothetical protein DCL35_06320 [Candidatus Omnitrophica bacterium]|nr:hypothetical protein [Candidatus Omnitrophota bacterium]
MKSKRILVFGNGFMGSRLSVALKAQVSGRKILSYDDAEDEIARQKPDIVINAIGHTGGRNVDGCEDDKNGTLVSNAFVPLILAEAALRRKIKLIHISSGCIYHFDYKRDRPIVEDKTPDFFDLFYSRTKIYAERALDILADKYGVLIARIRIPLDDRPSPRNILTKLIGYKKVITLANSVTYIPDFIEALKHLIKIDARGIYNIVSGGGLKYMDLLDVYKKYSPDFNYDVIDYKKLGLVRTNLIMSTKKIERAGFRMRPVSEVLEECVKSYIKY